MPRVYNLSALRWFKIDSHVKDSQSDGWTSDTHDNFINQFSIKLTNLAIIFAGSSSIESCRYYLQLASLVYYVGPKNLLSGNTNLLWSRSS
jgi:hypothetical protein